MKPMIRLWEERMKCSKCGEELETVQHVVQCTECQTVVQCSNEQCKDYGVPMCLVDYGRQVREDA